MPPAVVTLAVVAIAKAREVAGNVSSKQRVAVNEVKTEAEKGVLSRAPFLFGGRVSAFDGLADQLFKAWSQFGDDLDAIVAENLFVIDFDDPAVFAFRSRL